MKRLIRIVTASAAGFLILGAFATGASADGNVQVGSNSATNLQGAVAISGDASAVFGSAKTGDATAVNLSVQKQSIDQDAANINKGCKCLGNHNIQIAGNESLNLQEAAAASGDADSIFGQAESGDATAVNVSVQKQSIDQDAFNLTIGKKKFGRY